MKKVIVGWLFLLLMAGPALTAAAQTSPEDSEQYAAESRESPSGGAMFGDAVVVRPFGVVLTALGVCGTVISLPFSIPSGSVGAISEKLIARPFAFTFTRPLGVFPVDTVPWN